MSWRTDKRDDAVLLDGWRTKRDASAFTLLVTRHSGMVYATCHRILGNSATAEEVSQESFLALARGEGEIPVSPGAWLHTVASRLSLKRLHSDAKRHAREESFMQCQDTETHQEWDDIKRHVDKAIEELSPSLQSVVVAHFLEQRTHRQIAKDLGVTRQAVTYQVRKAVTQLRSNLDQRGVKFSAPLISLLSTNAIEAAPASLLSDLGRMDMAGGQTVGLQVGSTSLLTQFLSRKIITSALVIASLITIVGTYTLLQRNGRNSPEEFIPAPASTTLSTEPGLANVVAEAAASLEGTTYQQPTPPPSSISTDRFTSSLSGRVVMAKSGTPVAGALVSATHSTSRINSSGLTTKSVHTRTAVTASDGFFVIERLTNAIYELEAGIENLYLADGPLRMDFRNGVEQSDIVLSLQQDPDQSGGILRGKVTIGGKPIGSAQVNITYDPILFDGSKNVFPTLDPPAPWRDRAYTNSKGEFFIDQLPAGTFRLHSQGGTYILEIRSGAETFVNVEHLAPGTSVIEGWIVPPENALHAEVNIWGDTPGGASMRKRTEPDENGHFIFDYLPETTWHVIVDDKHSDLIRVKGRLWTNWQPHLEDPLGSEEVKHYPPRKYYERYEDARAALNESLYWETLNRTDREFSEAWVTTKNGKTSSVQFEWNQ